MPLETLLERIQALPAFRDLRASLPNPGEQIALSGLFGSSDALLVGALSLALTQRFLVVVTDSVPDGERWLADLEIAIGTERLAFYPPREGFGEMEPHAEVAGERVETLERISRGAVQVLITTARALLEKTRLPSALRKTRLELRARQTVRPETLATHLEAIGFNRVAMIDDVGQFSVRGGVFDIYGFGMSDPVRLEFWGDEITEIRHFDLRSQRSTRNAEVAVVLPLDRPVQIEGESFERLSVSELWPPDALLFLPLSVRPAAEFTRAWDEAEHHIELARRRGEDVPDRSDLFVAPEIATARLNSVATLSVVADSSSSASADRSVRFPIRAPEPIDRDIRLLRETVRDSMPTVILCDNSGQAERLEELMTSESGVMRASLVVGALDRGFIIPPYGNTQGLRVLTDHEIFRRARRTRRARRYASGTSLDMTGLKSGDYVVHLDHGIGIYRGMEKIVVHESTIEVAVVEYEGGDRLNVPLYRIDQIERYRPAADTGEDAPPPRLHRLGGKRWKGQRDKTISAINEMTAELLDLYSRRKVASRPPNIPDTAWQRQLESSFLFEDTPDQRRATEDVKKDLESGRPMDRLLVGDVGYGKTEIAVRAAFKVVQSGRQVAVLVPTTILADQHARTFGDRLADFPVMVRTLSRFESALEQKAILEEVAAGKVDVIIGTHRLLSPDVIFANLGLIVVDEEHRFGVKHKERLKQLKVETDVLTLTATPIPRTLHQSLAGLRDMTLMQTAPRDRSPVLTFVEPFDDALIEEGIARELDRGGQVFFVHNRIETIDAIAQHVERLAPSAELAVAHGQMKERDLELVMRRFVAGEVRVLVSTMIVESGLDVPNANTMFVNRADRFGLAQLYQLRGRVGRSHRRAYCYLMVPDAIDPEAERRLQVLEHHTELGSGYRIALRDMEMRGAGNLLGPEQSGYVHTVGFDMYLRMLDEAVHAIGKSGGERRIRYADVTVDMPAFLPDDYVPGAEAKLDIYRRISRVAAAAEIDDLRTELRDRFGVLPAPAGNLLNVAVLRVVGGELGVEGVLVRGDEARVNFRNDAIPRMRGLSAAFHEVQFAAEVKRSHPLSLKLTRLGGSEMLNGLVRAFHTLL